MAGQTYLNAYEILSQVRYDINEYSTAYMQATDTSGAFQNAQLMTKINQAQRIIFNFLFSQVPELFLTSASLTFASSISTLPSDFYRFKRLENSDGVKISPIGIDEKHVYDDAGSSFLYYRYGNTLRLDKDGESGTYTLWYYTRPRELDQGTTAAGGAATVTLATTAKKIADYYNNMMIEDITGDATDTISDYSAARVCTVTNTWAASRYYGIITEMPESFAHLIQPRATILCKGLPQSPEKPLKTELMDFSEMMRATLIGYAGTSFTDVSYEDIINDFQPYF